MAFENRDLKIQLEQAQKTIQQQSIQINVLKQIIDKHQGISGFDLDQEMTEIMTRQEEVNQTENTENTVDAVQTEEPMLDSNLSSLLGSNLIIHLQGLINEPLTASIYRSDSKQCVIETHPKHVGIEWVDLENSSRSSSSRRNKRNSIPRPEPYRNPSPERLMPSMPSPTHSKTNVPSFRWESTESFELKKAQDEKQELQQEL